MELPTRASQFRGHDHFNHRPNFRPSPRNNLTPNERKALKELCNNKDIIIKPADKGSAVVIMQREDYLREGYEQLSDPKFYRKLEHEPTADFHKEIRIFLECIKTQRLISLYKNPRRYIF